MPRRARKQARRPRRKAPRRGRKSNPSRAISTAGAGQNASIVETIEFANLIAGRTQLGIFNLAEFPRASQIAPYFQFYKAAKVVWTYSPLYNTYTDLSGVNSLSKPMMYVTMNRCQEAPINNYALAQIQATGARPQAFATKKEFSYVPNWCSPGIVALTSAVPPATGILTLNTQGLQKQFGWIGTPRLEEGLGTIGSQPNAVLSLDYQLPDPATAALNFPNTCLYNGHMVYVDQLYNEGPFSPIARVTCQVHWVFKGAKLNQAFTEPTPPTPPQAL